ncbi:ABC transporter permease [Brevibacillus laterosporus]|uniref:ABC transporter permease n=1 Tax=Brevibacillus laterosporus TaxID=1465 RepID=UPI0018F88C44|nr:ABC transporter permease [Brevibacillus laterosporus]MBG9774580.1 bacitracin ABC transporter permease [Brevibacillus laterosporus]MCR8937122.1 ABC transporter permease [Brevibacillus laterosporus]MCZ0839760.1 ABC transporter permease [Brevibacillus laterosporus]MCZ0845849.1 ABC transporter permease [Brevibacillus laterosporus]
MVNLFCIELLKLKRAKMFFVSMIGAASAPIMVFIGFLNMKMKTPDVSVQFHAAFYNTNLYTLLLIGTLLYGVITAYLFNREYVEDTLKNLLTIPVSRASFFVSKLVLLLVWILLLTIMVWGLTLILGLIGQFEGLSSTLLIQSFTQYIIGGFLLFLLSTPTMLVTFLFKNYVPTIIFTAMITMTNVALANSEYRVLFPYSAVQVIATNGFVPEYAPVYSYLSILITSIVGFIVTTIYFNKADIH